ncbi:3-oxoacyl-(acyl-carrier-protein) reductase [Halosimplex carlsbadense 2-9-1]|uniref:3-oxoacyl-(Acyl-carrier-protein) reductase n=1 Tax=Halosimplex carlsbadense 2-9-1 TaxID=797114 RepID=M0D4E2_9EURY|nr:SDR family oxidoreductase [Halosimplex carlsbadense]ELZ29723.1 3-oxoacyl-(acyl-carrier-protein) reductase [Halosimplex carlsbadense 2-9-1]
MTGRVADSVAVVTGGARGIGAATARRLAEEGADVAVVDVLAEQAERVSDEIADDTGRETLAVECDVGGERAVEAMAATVADRFGEVDILVNNAGIRVDPKPVTEADEESWDRILAVNQKGVAFCAKHLIPLMTGDEESGDRSDGSGGDDGRGPEGNGSVVNVASMGSEVARPAWAQYDSTKGAIVAMTKDMACDHAPDGIRVNAVSPGYVVTEYHLPDDPEEAREYREEQTTPSADGPGILKRAADPREVADAVLFLAAEESSFVTGTNLRVDGGVSAVGNGFDWDPA